jgi:hypothetical protein
MGIERFLCKPPTSQFGPGELVAATRFFSGKVAAEMRLVLGELTLRNG